MRSMPAKNGHSADFERLGRASVIIVHDIKNQLNGLKLYATFLRKRLDRDERPQDERETVAKLMAGLDPSALINAIKAFAERASAVSNTHPLRLVLNPVNDTHEARIEWRVNFPVN